MNFEIWALKGEVMIKKGKMIIIIPTLLEPTIVQAFRVADSVEKGEKRRIFVADVESSGTEHL